MQKLVVSDRNLRNFTSCDTLSILEKGYPATKCKNENVLKSVTIRGTVCKREQKKITMPLGYKTWVIESLPAPNKRTPP
ncbi:hypothetical protein CK510_23355 [Brunnivagina elsteri CCALA 953]|uniref:Uncharacterized protein n=1 Tax=Brunnivagina elsteri CCALA 953 TaxID=987040 RepID=A0A2A2TDI7_9CYAN|nr:hypothetical protein CK510_23355 [Calothrix elsteri CCALA 953]